MIVEINLRAASVTDVIRPPGLNGVWEAEGIVVEDGRPEPGIFRIEIQNGYVTHHTERHENRVVRERETGPFMIHDGVFYILQEDGSMGIRGGQYSLDGDTLSLSPWTFRRQ
jgi:hypothetical protein